MTRFFSQARIDGKTRYFTGKPCKHGHVAERYTSTRACVECISGTTATSPKTVQVVPLYVRSFQELNAIVAAYVDVVGSRQTIPRADAAYAEAVSTRADLYANGRPCSDGHRTVRFTHRRTCVECERIAGRGSVTRLGWIPFAVFSNDEAKRLRDAALVISISYGLQSEQHFAQR